MSTLKELENTDELHNPSAQRANSLFNAENTIGQNSGVNAGIDQAEQYANDPKNASKNVNNQEQDVASNSPWVTSVTSNKSDTSNKGRFSNFFASKKKKGALAGVVGGTGIIGVLFTIFGPMSMFISLTENLTLKNDGATAAYQKRIYKVLGMKLEGQSELCGTNTKKIKCKMGRLSTKAMKKMAKKGVTPISADGEDLSKSKKRYPNKQIAYYRIDDNGTERKIKPSDIKGYLANNPKLAAKLLGRSGAFNVKFEVWRGKYVKKNFYDRFNIKRNGGIADGSNKTNVTAADTLKDVKQKLPPASDIESKAVSKINAKNEKMIKRGKRGGTTYLAAVGACVGVKLPSMIAYGVAATQAARLAPLVNEVILSPGSKNKASLTSNISAEDMSRAGDVLTAQDSNGKSALDSKILLSAVGANKSKTGVSETFAPGYSILTNPTIQGMNAVSYESEETCNVVLSPQAMYSAMAINSATTILASATLVGGIAKVAVDWALSFMVSKVIEKATEAATKQIISELAENDELDKVLSGEPGEKLGDALGTSAMVFFASGAAARHTPVLRQSQLIDNDIAKMEQQQKQKEMDIASLSPFDISSPYTFLGSVVHDMNIAALSSGAYSRGTQAPSLLLAALQSPFRLLSSNASANTSPSTEYCGYAKDFGMDTGDDSTPAINAAGMPCYGYTGDISPEKAIDIALGDNGEGEPWIKDEADEEADVSEITNTDTRLYEYLTGCGVETIDEGSWNSTAAGCTIETAKPATPPTRGNVILCQDAENPDCLAGEDIGETKIPTAKEIESEAVAAFAMDYQISQMIDGFDEEPVAVGDATTGGGSQFKIGTFNILYSTARPSDWEGRLDRSMDVIRNNNLDVVGLQEVRKNQWSKIKSEGGLGSTHDVFPNEYMNEYGDTNPIIWNKDRFSLEQGDYVAAKRSKPNIHTNNKAYIRVKLKDNNTGQQFYVINTHQQYGGDAAAKKARYDDSLLLKSEVEALADAPVFVVGDFNSGLKRIKSQGVHLGDVNNLTYCILTGSNLLWNAYDARDNQNGKCPKETVATNDGGHDPSPVDHIFMSTAVQINKTGSGIEKNGVWRAMKGPGNNGSDVHDTVMASVTIPGEDGDGSGDPGAIAWPVDKKYWDINKNDFLKAHSANSGTWTNGVRSLAADIGSPPDGSAVYSMLDGTVSKSDLGGHGLVIKSQVDGGVVEMAYAHGPRENNNSSYKSGDKIMKIGCLGNCSGGHLHLDISFTPTGGAKKGVCPQDVFLSMNNNQPINWSTLANKAAAPCGRS